MCIINPSFDSLTTMVCMKLDSYCLPKKVFVVSWYMRVAPQLNLKTHLYCVKKYGKIYQSIISNSLKISLE